MGDDPITFYNNQLHTFYLPEGELVPLLRTPELQLLGSAYWVGEEQWINRLIVRGPLDEPVLTVSIMDDIAFFNRTTAPADGFETLNITLDYISQRLTKMPSPTSFASRWGTVHFAFGQVPGRKIGNANAEIIVLNGESARIIIMTTASEGVEPHIAAQNAHLDFTLNVQARDTCEGVLPEIWGIKPMSSGTEAMLQPLDVHLRANSGVIVE